MELLLYRIAVVKFSNFLKYALLLIVAVATPIYADADDGLILAVHPYRPAEVLIKKFTPMAEYISEKIGKKVTVKIGSNYEEHIQYIGQDRVDIAYMGPASFVNMEEKFGHKPALAKLAMTEGRSWFQGNIITRKESDIKTLADLKGKRFAFGDPASTMSYIVPHHMLYKAGVFSGTTSKHQFLYSHNNVALAVLSGDFDAGAVKPAVFHKFKDKGLRTIAKTPKISEHLFVARADCPAELVEKLRKVMFEMHDSEQGIAALHAIKQNLTGLVKVDSSDYDNLRTIIIESRDLH